jgi:tetratricopeptide (TPR) repeat protein
LSDHPSRDELAALSRGGLSPERERAVVRHLLTPCQDCLAEAPSPLRVLLGLEPLRRELTTDEDAAYDAVIGRALKTALSHRRHLQGQRAQAREAVAALEQGGFEAVQNLPHTMGNLARMEAFLERAWQLRHENPRLMVQFAWLAAQISLKLDPRRYGPARVSDFQAQAYAELGNAYRVVDQLQEAGDCLSRARGFFERGTQDRAREMRLLELEASLAADCRQFGRASVYLLKVLEFYNQQRDFHLSGRVLVKMGLYAGYAGDAEKAIRLLEKGLALVDGKRDPSLEYSARHNQVTFLIDCGHFREAEKKLFLLRPLCQHAGGRLNLLRFRWEEGRVAAGLQRFSRAEAVFRTLKPEFEEVDRPYDGALISLHLAAVLLAQGKSGEAMQVVLEAAETFKGLQIQREALQAVILLRNAFKVREATLAMVEEVAGFLRRIEIDPALRFEGQSWEGSGR